MHILDLNSFYSDLGGGVRTYTRQKMRFFRGRPEHRYTLVVGGAENRVDEEDGVRVYQVRGPMVSKANRYRQMFDWPEVARILRTERPDIVEVGSPYVDPWLAKAATGRSTLSAVLDSVGASFPTARPMKLVGFYHADFPDTYMAPFSASWPQALRVPFMAFWRRYVQAVYGGFDATITPSYWIYRKLLGSGVANAYPVPLGVDPEQFHPKKRDAALRASWGVGPDDVVLLYAGRFAQEKGVEVLFDALPDVLRRRADVKVLFVGKGPMEDRVRELAARAPDRVISREFIQDADALAAVYASADVFLAPGPYETFGLATLEAMASGLPVVAPSEGGSAETVSAAQAGVLFRAHDRRDFANKVVELLEADRRAGGRRARRFAETQMTWNDTFERMLVHYERLVHGALPRPDFAARRDAGADRGRARGAQAAAFPGFADAGAVGGAAFSPALAPVDRSNVC